MPGCSRPRRRGLREDPAAVRLFMLDYLAHVRTLTARTGPNRGKRCLNCG
ncbi:hypothetical protein GCM10018952_74290 [Streptosporangium vulgare]